MRPPYWLVIIFYHINLFLTILFGFIGINKFYAGKIKQGILSILFCWTLIPLILSIAEFIVVLTRKADKQGKININTEIISRVKFITSLVIFILFVIGSIIPWESLIENLKVFSDFNHTDKPVIYGLSLLYDAKYYYIPLYDQPMLERLIDIFTDRDDVVIDPCAGSGTTLRAAAQRGRRSYGFEIKKDFYKDATEKVLFGLQSSLF